MKIRSGFVSNSSSSSFLITNTSDKDKTLVDFVKEVGQEILEEFYRSYSWYKEDEETTFPNMLESAKKDWQSFDIIPAGHSVYWTFGDEDGTVYGRVFDYGLRDGGETENFSWYMTDCRGSSYFAEMYDEDYDDEED